MPGHEFWPDGIPYTGVDLSGAIGRRRVTYAYLVALAASRGGKLATMDRGLALLHREHVALVG
jgi:hypothetical protein